MRCLSNSRCSAGLFFFNETLLCSHSCRLELCVKSSIKYVMAIFVESPIFQGSIFCLSACSRGLASCSKATQAAASCTCCVCACHVLCHCLMRAKAASAWTGLASWAISRSSCFCACRASRTKWAKVCGSSPSALNQPRRQNCG